MGSFIHSFSKYVINIYDMPGTKCSEDNEQDKYNPHLREAKLLNR